MADKRLAEQNQRWLCMLHTSAAELQAALVDELSRCTRESPDVSWDRIDDLIKRSQAIVQMATRQRV